MILSGINLHLILLNVPERLHSSRSMTNEPLIVQLAIGLHIMFVQCAFPSLHCHSLILILVFQMRTLSLLHHLNINIFLLIWHSSWLNFLLFHSMVEEEEEVEVEVMMCHLIMIHLLLGQYTTIFLLIWHSSWLLCLLFYHMAEVFQSLLFLLLHHHHHL
jgi:hypothetical protein